MNYLTRFLSSILLGSLLVTSVVAKPVHHYVFFNMERDRIREATFLETKALEGAQLKFTWRELEPRKDEYDFSQIRKALEFLTSKGKRLWIQLQDVSFSGERVMVPEYLRTTEYGGGVVPQYEVVNNDEANAKIAGWVAKRWEPAVQVRFHKLLDALGREFDGKIEGINLPETAIDFGETGKLRPAGFTPARYREAVIENMKALKRAFPKSVAMQYANFMPGEWLPADDNKHLKTVYEEARKMRLAVGGPDVLPFKKGQNNHSYPLLAASDGIVPIGMAVQEGNYSDVNPKTGKRMSIEELLAFATDRLKADYVFWCTEEPYYSKELIPLMSARK